jgi:hypothetical protein
MVRYTFEVPTFLLKVQFSHVEMMSIESPNENGFVGALERYSAVKASVVTEGADILIGLKAPLPPVGKVNWSLPIFLIGPITNEFLDAFETVPLSAMDNKVDDVDVILPRDMSRFPVMEIFPVNTMPPLPFI